MTMKRSTLAPAAVIAAVIILLSAVLITIGITYATEQEPPLPDASSSVSAGGDCHPPQHTERIRVRQLFAAYSGRRMSRQRKKGEALVFE